MFLFVPASMSAFLVEICAMYNSNTCIRPWTSLLKGHGNFPLLRGTLWGKSKFVLNFAKGTTAKAQGTTASAVGAVGYFEACNIVLGNTTL